MSLYTIQRAVVSLGDNLVIYTRLLLILRCYYTPQLFILSHTSILIILPVLLEQYTCTYTLFLLS